MKTVFSMRPGMGGLLERGLYRRVGDFGSLYGLNKLGVQNKSYILNSGVIEFNSAISMNDSI